LDEHLFADVAGGYKGKASEKGKFYQKICSFCASVSQYSTTVEITLYKKGLMVQLIQVVKDAANRQGPHELRLNN
jgi:hypothetical protein